MDIEHTDDGFEKLLGLLHKVDQAFEAKPVCLMESTGHYHKRLFEYLTENGYKVAAVSPLQSKSLQGIDTPAAKTDRLDAYRLVLLYRLKVNKVGRVPDDAVVERRMLTGEYLSMTDTTLITVQESGEGRHRPFVPAVRPGVSEHVQSDGAVVPEGFSLNPAP